MAKKNTETTGFVYAKGKEIKLLGLTDARSFHDELIADGWVHTETLEMCAYIQFLHNNLDEKDIARQIMSLSNRTGAGSIEPPNF